VQDAFRSISDVPVTENLYFSGALGIAGPQPLAADAARGVLVQLAGLHSPAELVVTAVVSSTWTNEFEWLKWLPHTASPHSPLEAVHLANSQATGGALLSAIEELIASRAKDRELRGAKMFENSALVAGAAVGDGADEVAPPPAATPAVVLLISDDAPVDRARLVQVAERAADAGVYPIWVSATQQQLPAVARTYVSVDSEGARVGLVRLGDAITGVRTEPVTREQALWFAKRLAPVTDAGALVEDSSDRVASIDQSVLPSKRTSKHEGAHARSVTSYVTGTSAMPAIGEPSEARRVRDTRSPSASCAPRSRSSSAVRRRASIGALGRRASRFDGRSTR